MHNTTDIFFPEEENPEKVMTSVQSMTRSALFNVLSKTGVAVDFKTVAGEISQQVLIEIFAKELSSLVEVRGRIKSLCFTEISHAIRYRTGREDSFGGKIESFDDPRILEDESDSAELISADSLKDRQLGEADQRKERLSRHYEYLIQELYGSYLKLNDEFLQKLFLERFVEGKSRSEVGQTIRNRKLPRTGIHPGSVRQCEEIIFQKINGLTGIPPDKIRVLIMHARDALEHYMRLSGTEKALVDLFFEIGGRNDGFRKFGNLKLDEIPTPSESSNEVIRIPELLTDHRAEGLRAEAMTGLRDRLDSFLRDPAQFSQGTPQRLFPHQYEKLRGVIEYLERQLISGSEKSMMVDIAPPSAGKTYMQAVLAKLLGLPFVFVTPFSTIIEGSDSAMAAFGKLFPMQELGVVATGRKEFGRLGTFTTYKSFSQQETLRNILTRPSGEEPPLLFLMDEGDLGQTEMRKQVLDALRRSLKCPLICAFSATTKVAGRDLADIADVVDKMELRELVSTGKAKHILGFFVDGRLTVTAKKLQRHGDDENVLFSRLKSEEKEAFTEIPVELVLENHRETQGIIHCMSVEHAQSVAERLKEEGINARCISATDLTERNLLKEQYVDGKVQILTSCEVLGRGFSDYGATTFIIFAAITSSLTSLYQKIGRGFRPNPRNNLLTVYQLMPAEIQNRAFIPVTLYDIFDPADSPEILSATRGDLSARDYMKKVAELVEERQLEFTGIVGRPTVSTENTTFLDRKRVEEVIDTRKEWPSQAETFLLTEDNINEYFFPVLEKFMKVGQVANHSELNTNTPNHQMTVVIDGRSIRWRNFILSVIRVLTGMEKPERIKYYSLGLDLIKEWGSTRKRPSSEFVRERMRKARIARKEKDEIPRFELTPENIDKSFFPIMDLFVEELGLVATESLDEVRTAAFRTARVEINGEPIIGETFLRRTLGILAGINTQEALGFLSLAGDITRKWYKDKCRPDNDYVQARLEEEKRKRDEAPPKLKLTPENIDGLFVPIVNGFIEKLGGNEGDCSCIDYKLDCAVISINGEILTGRLFLLRILRVLAKLKNQEPQKFLSFGIELIRKWYADGRRPPEDFIARRLREEKADKQRKADATIDDEFIEKKFMTIVDGFVEELGADGYERLGSSSKYNKTRIIVDGIEIRWMYFIMRVNSLFTGMGISESSYFKSLGLVLIKEWYRAGERPNKELVRGLVEKAKMPKGDGRKRRSHTKTADSV